MKHLEEEIGKPPRSPNSFYRPVKIPELTTMVFNPLFLTYFSDKNIVLEESLAKEKEYRVVHTTLLEANNTGDSAVIMKVLKSNRVIRQVMEENKQIKESYYTKLSEFR